MSIEKTITFDEVVEYRKNIFDTINNELQTLEKSLISARDDQKLKIPIYLTKFRVKSINSIYLKTKRQQIDSLDKITDYGGLRILCLFERDLIKSTEYLTNLLSSKSYDVEEIKLFNWNREDKRELKQEIQFVIRNVFPDITQAEPYSSQRSGYTSIHFLVYFIAKNKKYPIEIQVRTLLQDTWGELEHALVYKRGKGHPHIVKNFFLLSRDLETTDMLISHLRSIKDKENCVSSQTSRTGPYKSFGYESDLLPILFRENNKYANLFEKFEAHRKSAGREKNIKEWINEYKNIYDEIQGSVSTKESKDHFMRYWLDIESAYIAFTEDSFIDAAGRRYETAVDKYTEIISRIEKLNKKDKLNLKCYIPYFRRGEISFIIGDIESALIDFDRSEEIMLTRESNIIGNHNHYRIKVKIANSYWQLGEEYYDLALKAILDAEKLYNNSKGSSLFTEQDKRLLINNLCWYKLEKYIKDKDVVDKDESEKNYLEAENQYRILEDIINTTESHNAYDTALWFCYQSYLKTGDRDYLKKAKQFCLEAMDKKVIYSTNKIGSEDIFRAHFQEIMSIE